MKAIGYGILLLMEFCLAKLIFLVVGSMITNGLAEVLGFLMVLAIGSVMVALWRFGKRALEGDSR